MEDKIVMQVIKDIQKSGLVKDPKAEKKYCLLGLFHTTTTNLGGAMIDMGDGMESKWYNFKIIKEFKDKKEAEDYAKKHNVKLAYNNMID